MMSVEGLRRISYATSSKFFGLSTFRDPVWILGAPSNPVEKLLKTCGKLGRPVENSLTPGNPTELESVRVGQP
jgi:hypothetical protein